MYMGGSGVYVKTLPPLPSSILLLPNLSFLHLSRVHSLYLSSICPEYTLSLSLSIYLTQQKLPLSEVIFKVAVVPALSLLILVLLLRRCCRLRSRTIDAPTAATAEEEEEGHDFKLSEKDAEDITLSGSAAKENNLEPAALDCPVCLDGFREGDLCRRLRCGHIFHPDCIDAWLKKGSNSCPMCRLCFLPQDCNNSQQQPYAISHV